ncbi:hypothetical protein POM88_031757 [Heracleum sosnowskyi]|uniref:Uncharacterized protein n=1 Tax=Heracleum sosnowskyi TaxID=360622 RepID=A0AAD8HY00_9APIA|nr:hypothetical protein POM88_031757 [Heracleum sosnowskyi]
MNRKTLALPAPKLRPSEQLRTQVVVYLNCLGLITYVGTKKEKPVYVSSTLYCIENTWALTLRQAVLTAAVLEFSGALLMGKHVTSTMQKGILVANVFQGKDTLLLAGLLSSLAAAGTWLQDQLRLPM